ncbi:MAG: acyclic terpene utilization AtuA family protein [Thermodesulfobacteriota bacterium]
MKSIRLGCGSASWGDMLDPAVELVEKGDIQYLGFDHLAELTMSILQRMKDKNPKRGYIPDFIPWMRAILPKAAEKGIKIITNAGGANPGQAALDLMGLTKELGISGLKVGVVSGDDVMTHLEDFRKKGIKFKNMDTGEEDIDRIKDKIVAAHVYIGSESILEGLQNGADLVITGRASDNAIYVAPMAYEFGWALDDWEKMGTAVTIGHIIECSAGCAAGMSNFWKEVKEPWRVAFPIAQVWEDGRAVITKAPGSGRMVTEWTVKEHLVYEIHDPANYLMPDAVADLSQIRLKDLGQDQVEVANIKGKKRPDNLKMTIGFEDGWIGESEITVCWPDAYKKAQFCEEFLRGRFKAKGLVIDELRFDYIGINSIHGPLAKLPEKIEDINEVRVRVAAKTPRREDANQVRREVTHLWTHGPVGTTAVISPPPPRQVIGLWPTLVARELVPTQIQMLEV